MTANRLMKIELLTFPACPNAKPARELLHSVLDSLGIREKVLPVEVENEEAARRLRFLGSPSIHVNGEDIEAPRRGDSPAFSCRIYRDEQGRMAGVPPRQLIEAALRSSS
jgi:hypothetical protein